MHVDSFSDVEDEDGNIGNEDGSDALMLHELEEQNHRMGDKLVEKGYALAQLKKHTLRSSLQARLRDGLWSELRQALVQGKIFS